MRSLAKKPPKNEPAVTAAYKLRKAVAAQVLEEKREAAEEEARAEAVRKERLRDVSQWVTRAIRKDELERTKGPNYLSLADAEKRAREKAKAAKLAYEKKLRENRERIRDSAKVRSRGMLYKRVGEAMGRDKARRDALERVASALTESGAYNATSGGFSSTLKPKGDLGGILNEDELAAIDDEYEYEA